MLSFGGTNLHLVFRSFLRLRRQVLELAQENWKTTMKLFKTVCLLFFLLVGLSAMGQQAMLTEPVPQTNHLFGNLVALKKDFAAVMTLDNHPASSIYLYQEAGAGWKSAQETAQLTTSSGAILNSLAADEGIVVAGSATGAVNGVQTGLIYVWVEPAKGWVNATETAILSTSDGQGGDDCGNGVAVTGHGKFIVGGCPGWNNDQGRALIFVEPANGWASGTERFHLTASDGQSPDFFGYSVSMQGPVIAVGAPNKASRQQSKCRCALRLSIAAWWMAEHDPNCGVDGGRNRFCARKRDQPHNGRAGFALPVWRRYDTNGSVAGARIWLAGQQFPHCYINNNE